MTIARTICLGFIAVISVGTILLMMPFAVETGNWGSFITALFTSTSAVCVTGLIVVDTGTYFSFWGELIILCLIQIGGLGYMTTSTFLILLIGKKFDFRQKIAISESFDRPFLQGSRNLVISIFVTTFILEIIATIVLYSIFSQDYGWKQGLWLAIFHSVSAWNNAGFSLFPDSLIQYQSSIPINIVITTLIILGGIGYQVIIEVFLWFLDFFKQKVHPHYEFSLNFKVVTRTTLILLILGTVGFFITELHNNNTLAELPFKDKIITAWFQSVTTRTAGFNSIDIGAMTKAGLFITIGLMFIGASPSGTGGGIKTTTLSILYNSTKAVLRGQEQVVMHKREVPVSLILKAMAVVFGSGVTVVCITFFISLLHSDFEFQSIFFEVVSAFATVGLSTGITSSLSVLAKLAIVFTMYLGRVGVLLFMAAIVGDPQPSRIEYPEENLLVG
ncbi:TrkH family potassium uptake protein [Cyanobacterium aponinum AL20118]|uniref:TrkH family potassium uptake protein n=1 Tax=Cyanobacterium aponinum AL20115 TaxID=3090662 RepID=A0AAF1C3R3_9CHRO|nr:TrkH family potassium uptake protein [Cyanobacterium aponinum]WPF90158.1 TrkH family potassium uptake protein [Cyanobacterium aponinum AL20115]